MSTSMNIGQLPLLAEVKQQGGDLFLGSNNNIFCYSTLLVSMALSESTSGASFTSK